MGVSRSPAELQRKLKQLEANIQKRNFERVKEAAKIAKDATLVSAAAATGGDLRISNVGRSGAKLGVGYTIRKSGVDVSARVKARGKWQFVEYPIKAHAIRPKKRTTRRGRTVIASVGTAKVAIDKPGRTSTRGALNTPYGPRAFVMHPGVQDPKQPWRRGIRFAEPVMRRTMTSWLGDELRKVF